jgi:hypothetical protein
MVYCNESQEEDMMDKKTLSPTDLLKEGTIL